MKRATALGLLLALVALPGAARAVTYNEFTYERTRVAMRDGVTLSVDIWRPVTPEDVKVPVILTLTPYHVLYKALDRREDDLPTDLGQNRWVQAGFAYARADVRGTYLSGGCWDYGGLKERQDGYDLVEWLAGFNTDGSPSPAAAWSNGKVGMIGVSYDGTTANAAAVEQPPHLATIVPISAISRWWGYAYQQFARATTSGESVDIDPPGVTPPDFMFGYGFLPPPAEPGSVPDPQQTAMRWTPCDRDEQLSHAYDPQPDYDEYWVERDYLRLADRVQVPVLVAHGFLDFNVKTWEGTAWFQALRTPKVLVAGQWAHAQPAYAQWTSLVRRWFERWLYDIPNGVELEPSVRVEDNTRSFRTQADWGVPASDTRALAGGDVTIFDDGALTESEMVRGTTPERYARVVVPDSSDIHIEGRPVLALSATSDMPSTHFVAVLCDVPNGGDACTIVSRAFMNARYRGGRDVGEDLTPGAPDVFELEFIDKDYTVAPNRHLEVIIASSSSTWVAPDALRARNILHLNASTLALPLTG